MHDVRFPVSLAQQRLWFLHRMEPASTAYHMTEVFRLAGDIDVAALSRSVDELVGRHEILRTAFAEIDGDPVQVPDAARPCVLEVIDAEASAPPAGAADVASLAREIRDQPYDLHTGPLLRMRLVLLGERDAALVVGMHHIVSDGQSLEILYRELSAFYNAAATGAADAGLPELPIQFLDYAIWHRDNLSVDSRERHAKYWEQTLADLPEPLDLGPGGTRAGSTSGSARAVNFELPSVLAEQLRQIGAACHVSLSTTLLAAFHVLLARLSGQPDVVVGLPEAGRTRSETEELIGFFVNTLPVRVDLSDGPVFTELAVRVHQAVIGALEHQDMPFEQIVEIARPDRVPGVSPVAQAMFQMFEGGSYAAPAFEGIETVAVPVPDAETTFDISLAVSVETGRFSGQLVCRADVIDQLAAEGIAGAYHVLLASIGTDPWQRVTRLQLTADLPAGTTAVDGHCLTDLLTAEARLSAESCAIVFDGVSLTYAELHSRVNKLARYLIRLGAGPEQLVAVGIPRSVELVVALLAILQSGAAYLPLDLSQPSERLGRMTSAGRPVLTLVAASSVAESWVRGEVVVVDSAELAVALGGLDDAALTDDDRLCALKADHPAYVMFTSGSTGLPKGVVVPHRGVANRLLTMDDCYRISSADRVLLKAPVTFDASARELLWPLISGACLVVARPDGHSDPGYLAQLIQDQHVTVVDFVPAMLEMFLDEPAASRCTSIAFIAGGGDKLTADVAQRCADILGGAKLYNLYGPTEAAIDVTGWYVPTAGAAAEGPVPIGYPISNVCVYLLDAALQPVPVGVTGEIYIGGAALARGYANAADLTAERFVADPYGQPGTRIYRTGDLGRLRSDGAIEYLGRADDQVKLRGVRIELGEIQAAVEQLPEVRRAVVLLAGRSAGRQALTAYVVLSAGATLLPADLAAQARRILPAAMVPTTFVLLDSLPMTPSGKLDRRALQLGAPPPPGQLAQVGKGRQATLGEGLLCNLFAQILSLDHVGIDDNFFALGGHSLLAARLVSRIRAVFGRELTLRKIFTAPTPALLAAEVDRSAAARGSMPITHHDVDEAPLSAAQLGLWLVSMTEDLGWIYNVATAVMLNGKVDATALGLALADVAGRHQALRTVFPERDGLPRQVLLPLPAAEQLISVTEIAEEEIANRIDQASRHAFDLSRDYPIRGFLFALAGDRHVFLLVIHHMAIDGTSMATLAADLGTAYLSRRAGARIHWQAPTTTYFDYALWQQEFLRSAAADGDGVAGWQLEFWQDRLGGMPPELGLPFDHERPTAASYVTGSVKRTIDRQLHGSLAGLATSAQSSLFILLHAALAVVLQQAGAGDDIVIGTPAEIRPEASLDETVGLFVNTLVLRLDLGGASGFSEILARATQADLDAFGHADVPFSAVVDAVGPVRRPGRHPLFQVMLNLDTPTLMFAPPGVEAGLYDDAIAAPARFDISVTFAQSVAADSSPAGMTVTMLYNAALFDPPTIERMTDELVGLLELVAKSPDAAISTGAMSAGERSQVLEKWSGAGLSAAAESYPAVFDRIAVRSAEQVAIICGDTTLTYAELNSRSSQLASRLVAAGVGTECFVGLALSRSEKMVIAMLAVLKARGAYLPLDPEYPRERIASLVRQARPGWIIADAEIADSWPNSGDFAANITWLTVADDWDDSRWDDSDSAEATAGFGHTGRAAPLPPLASAYALATSGSTGTPKVIVVPHGGIVNLVHWAEREIFSGERVRVLAAASLNFDHSVFELLIPLGTGATVEIVPGLLDLVEHPRTLTADVVAGGVPSVLDQVLRAGGLRAPMAGAAGRIVMGGEALSAALVAELRAAAPGCRIWNVYGPSETTVIATAAGLGANHGTPSIGRPVPNAVVYVLDERLEPVPVGMPGEVYIAGEGVARGYLGQPALTAERFIADPFGSPGSRMYRSGDVARWTRDGELEFAGRADDQLKIRGYRIEAAEIEAALREVPGIAHAAVARSQAPSGRAQLAAFVVRAAGTALDPDAVRAALERRLPAYMVPRALTEVDALPLTLAGKLDRRALSALELPSGLAAPVSAPGTPTEILVAGIWSAEIGREVVDLHANFFEIGGDSLLAIAVVMKLRQATSLNIPLRAPFLAQTVKQLAANVDELARSDCEPADEAINDIPASRVS
jgi:pristinamycin I synthase 3 and 4